MKGVGVRHADHVLDGPRLVHEALCAGGRPIVGDERREVAVTEHGKRQEIDVVGRARGAVCFAAAHEDVVEGFPVAVLPCNRDAPGLREGHARRPLGLPVGAVFFGVVGTGDPFRAGSATATGASASVARFEA